MAVDQAGNIYIADSGNNLVRKVDANGTITTIAGDTKAAQPAADAKQPLGPSDSSGDGGPASAAHVDGPRGIAVAGLGDVYLARRGGDPATRTNGARIARDDPS